MTKETGLHLVLGDPSLLVRVVALDHRVVAGGGAGREALLGLVACGAVRRLVGIKRGRGIFLVESCD